MHVMSLVVCSHMSRFILYVAILGLSGYSRLSRAGLGPLGITVSNHSFTTNCCGAWNIGGGEGIRVCYWFGIKYSYPRRRFEDHYKCAELKLSIFGVIWFTHSRFQEYCHYFHCISFSHVCKDGNCVAHNLARHARYVTGFLVWMEDVPSYTFSTYQAYLSMS